MPVQTSYSYSTPRGVAGGLFDISPYAADSRQNGETKQTAMKFGMGVVRGTGSDVKLPTAASTAGDFSGVVLHMAAEQIMDGSLYIQPGASVSILAYGRAWVRLGAGAAPADGEPVYLIVSGEEAGCFTTADDTAAKLAVKARFKGGKDSGATAPAEFYYQMNEAPATPGA